MTREKNLTKKKKTRKNYKQKVIKIKCKKKQENKTCGCF